MGEEKAAELAEGSTEPWKKKGVDGFREAEGRRVLGVAVEVE